MLIKIWNIFDLKIKVGLIVFAVLLTAGTLLSLSHGPSRLTETLSAAGFTLSKSETTHARPGQIRISGISLDPDGFSMIGELKASGGALFPLFGEPKRLTIDNLQLTGEWNEEHNLSFAGWSLPRHKKNDWSSIDRIVLGESIIDLDTPVGALRLKLDGDSARNPNNSSQPIFNAHLSGIQHQLVLDSQIKGTWSLASGLSIESEIREARLNLDHLVASRVTGWFALETQTASPIPTVSGQFQAGQLGRDNLKLNNVALTLDGPITSPHVIINAELGGYQSASLLLETKFEPAGTHIMASIETKTMDDLLAILTELRTQAQTSPILQETLMSLLITEGNLDRIRDDLKKEKYESFVLEIEGLSHDLNGKVIGKKIKDGVMQRQIFSLNPSIAAGGN